MGYMHLSPIVHNSCQHNNIARLYAEPGFGTCDIQRCLLYNRAALEGGYLFRQRWKSLIGLRW